MTEPLDPQRRAPAASLNRVTIVDLPGLDVDAGLVGRTALDLLSAPALAEALLADADALGLDATERSKPGALPPLLDRCLASEDLQVRAAAERIARQFGRRLGYIILALRRAADALLREAGMDDCALDLADAPAHLPLKRSCQYATIRAKRLR